MKKIFFFDIDGTLLPYGHENVLDTTKYAIDQLHKDGHEVYIATGKCYADAMKVGNELGINGYITTNGQVIVKNGLFVKEKYFTKDDVELVYNLLKDSGVTLGVQGNYVKFLINDFDEENIDNMCNDISIDIPEYTSINNLEMNVGQMWGIGKFDPAILPDKFEVLMWPSIGSDIILKGASKGNAIKENFIIDGIITYAFGDGLNDVDMFKMCNISIAMGNSSKEVKRNATYVTDNEKEDGIYNFLVKHKLIEELK